VYTYELYPSVVQYSILGEMVRIAALYSVPRTDANCFSIFVLHASKSVVLAFSYEGGLQSVGVI
jgi:hypothetical protein